MKRNITIIHVSEQTSQTVVKVAQERGLSADLRSWGPYYAPKWHKFPCKFRLNVGLNSLLRRVPETRLRLSLGEGLPGDVVRVYLRRFRPRNTGRYHFVNKVPAARGTVNAHGCAALIRVCPPIDALAGGDVRRRVHGPGEPSPLPLVAPPP